MNDNLIKILINNTYHGFLGLFSLLAFMYTVHSLTEKQSIFGWIILILQVMMCLYHTMGMRKFK